MALAPARLIGAETTPVQQYQQAFAGDNSDAKRQALRQLADSSLPDAVVLPLLVQAVADRQAQDDAIAVLRQRTGLQPSVYWRQSHYPSYPGDDSPEAWEQWMQDWNRDHAKQDAIDQALETSRAALEAAQQAQAAVHARTGQTSTTSTPASSQP